MATQAKRSSEQMLRLSDAAETLSSCRKVLGMISNGLGARERKQLSELGEAIDICSSIAKTGSAALGGGSSISRAVAKRIQTEQRRSSLGKGESMIDRSHRSSSGSLAGIKSFVDTHRQQSGYPPLVRPRVSRVKSAKRKKADRPPRTPHFTF